MTKRYTDIPGWFVSEAVYDFLVSTVPKNGSFVECGAWLGRSSNYLCNIRADVNVTVVDHWLGSPDERETSHKLATETDIFRTFVENMKGLRYEVVRASSEEASERFADESLDVVFIDMTHTYDAVKEDIRLWLPKVKPDGILAGDDYANDWPEVVRAVRDGLPGVQTMGRCWIHRKSGIPLRF